MWEVTNRGYRVGRFETYYDAEFYCNKNDPQHLLQIAHIQEGK